MPDVTCISLVLQQVIVVEKGTYTLAQALPLQERDAFGTMYEGGGLMTTDNAGMQHSTRHLCEESQEPRPEE